jgi:hypothetical protein
MGLARCGALGTDGRGDARSELRKLITIPSAMATGSETKFREEQQKEFACMLRSLIHQRYASMRAASMRAAIVGYRRARNPVLRRISLQISFNAAMSRSICSSEWGGSRSEAQTLGATRDCGIFDRLDINAETNEQFVTYGPSNAADHPPRRARCGFPSLAIPP